MMCMYRHFRHCIHYCSFVIMIIDKKYELWKRLKSENKITSDMDESF